MNECKSLVPGGPAAAAASAAARTGPVTLVGPAGKCCFLAQIPYA